MLDRTAKSAIARCRDQSPCLTGDSARDLAQGFAHRYVRKHLTAFDDNELSDWLMECIEDGSENFLGAVAEAALAASADDYFVIPPALLALRGKHKANPAI
jgi:hypothetical protein